MYRRVLDYFKRKRENKFKDPEYLAKHIANLKYDRPFKTFVLLALILIKKDMKKYDLNYDEAAQDFFRLTNRAAICRRDMLTTING